MINKILEVSSRNLKGGRRPIKMALLTIHEGNDTNLNGIHWKEEYVLNNLDSINGIPICAEFLSCDKRVPNDHGYTDTVLIDDYKQEPLFENSEVVGVIESASIENVDIEGGTKRVLVGYGYLYCQRYPKFVDWVKENIIINNVKSSIEIMGKDENDRKIVYEGECNSEFRIPKSFDFSATAILSVKAADDNAYVLEVASKNENVNKEELTMNEEQLRTVIISAITEASDKSEVFNAKINELNSAIAEKDATIETLMSEKIVAETNSADKDARIAELERKLLDVTEELNKCKKESRKSEMNSAISKFTDEEKKYAEVEINSFNEDPLNGDIDAIVSKICTGIVMAEKEAAKVAELNSANNNIDDIFSEINSASVEELDDNIF